MESQVTIRAVSDALPWARPSATLREANSSVVGSKSSTAVKPDQFPSPQQPEKAKVSASAVERILRKQVTVYKGDLYCHKIVRWGRLEDGTNVGVIEDPSSAVRYAWTVDPGSFHHRRIGPVNE